MKILDAIKSIRQKPEPRQAAENFETPDAKAPAQGPTSGSSPADLWYALCEDPNRDFLLAPLLEICGKKGGPSAEFAALSELADIPGSWLPQTYLGRAFLAAGSIEEAMAKYRAVLIRDDPPDYAMFMISADLGRYGFANRMPELILPLFHPDRNNLFIGLNLLLALRDGGHKNEGLTLLESIRPYENDEIREYLDGFETDFAAMPAPTTVKEDASAGIELSDVSPVPAEPTADTGNMSPADSLASASSAESPEDQDAASEDSRIPAPTTRPVMLDMPVWVHSLIGLQDLLPNTVDRQRVGVYMYADTTPTARRMDLPEGAITPDELSVGLPLIIADRLLFQTTFKPIALFPAVRDKGPFGGNLEPDVQGLFGLCSKEALDFLVTGTIFQDHDILRVRTWILDRTKQSARVVAADLPVHKFGEAIQGMLSDIFAVFAERHALRGAAKADLLYALPPADLMTRYVRAMRRLLLIYLVRQNECDSSILISADELLSPAADLAYAEPKNQILFAMLLAGIHNLSRLGIASDDRYRTLLYEIADKNRYTPCVKAVMKELNQILRA